MNRSNGQTDTAVEIDVARLVEARLARISRGILALAIAVALLVMAVNIIEEGRVSQPMWMVASTLPILVVLLGLVRRGHTNAAVQGLIGVIYLVIIAVVITRGTVRVPASSLIILAAAMSGLVLGRRSMIVALAMGVLVVGGLALAEAGGLLRTPAVGPIFSYWLAISMFAIATGAVLSFARGIAEDALIRASIEIAERGEAERSLRESGERFRSLTDLSSDWYWEQDRELRLTFHSGGFARRSGTTSDRLLGKRRWEEPNRFPLSGTWDEHRATLEAHEPFRDFEYLRIGDDGQQFFVSLSGVPIYDAAGQFNGYRGVGTNITARKQAEQARRAAEEQFRGLVEQSIAGTYVIQDNKFAYVNPRLAEIFGYGSADQLIGRDPYSVVAEKDRDRVAENVRLWIKGNEASIGYDFTGVRKDGSTFDVGVHGARASHRGRPAVIGLIQDISEKKRAEEQIQRYVAQLETAFMSTVQVATTLGEMRDPYTAGHQRRVAEIAVAIGAELGFDGRRQEGLRVAGYLHDVGKIRIPSEILSKPGKLSALEFQLVQGHAQASYDVLKDVGFPWPVAEVALQHHERMDGSGYPQGLRGDSIMLEARIMAVADVVEAMSSHRPYRAGLGIEAALSEIERGRGGAYDAEVADACARLFRESSYQLPE